MPAAGVLPSLEVRGMASDVEVFHIPIVSGPVTDAKSCYRTRDTATRSANTRSSRSALRRWMNSGLLRTVRGAIDTNDTSVSTNVFELYETASYVNRDSDIVYPWTCIDVR